MCTHAHYTFTTQHTQSYTHTHTHKYIQFILQLFSVLALLSSVYTYMYIEIYIVYARMYKLTYTTTWARVFGKWASDFVGRFCSVPLKFNYKRCAFPTFIWYAIYLHSSIYVCVWAPMNFFCGWISSQNSHCRCRTKSKRLLDKKKFLWMI